ncbi:GxxExxY protein [Haloferula rosea]|uniref:GxxExxY protein n=1 Tax=Haloferula rosea TaxID=490093 RepID=A0A934VH19_9BACT|nr:GxxExxY protein [Haloferula rosea]MBK1828185.1 GxxExxY protein [Haloferula rosea]
MSFPLKDETYRILGSCFAVYTEKGCGFLEDVYQECLEIEFEDQSVPFVSQPKLELGYKGRLLRQRYQPDFLCYQKVVLEIKAVKKLEDVHRAQLMNYLKATRMKVGLLVNFGHFPKVEHERFVV